MLRVEALRIVALWRPDVLVSDIDMPDHDGYWLIRGLRLFEAKTGRNTPAFAVSAHWGPDYEKMAKSAGFQKCLTKPLNIDELVQSIADIAERNRVKVS